METPAIPDTPADWRTLAPSRFRPSRVVMAAAIATALAILGVTAADLWSRHESILRDTEARVKSLNLMLTEYVARSFEAIDRTLIAATDARGDYLERGPAAHPLAPHEMLRAIMHGTPLLQGLAWIDATGERTHAANGPRPARLNIAAQPQFTSHRDSPNLGLFISNPFRSILDNRWVIVVSRRVNDANGGFAGIVQSTLDIDYLDRTYGQMNPGPGTTLALYRDDGTILIRTPDTYSFIGQNVRDGVNFQSIFASGVTEGVVRGINVRDGRNGPERLGAFRAVPGLPLVTFVSMRLDAALLRWHESLYFMVPMAVLLSMLVLAGGAMFARQLERGERQRHDLVDASRRAEEAQLQALQASQAKSAFLASMSHELRTPLNAVIGYSQLLRLDPKATPAQRDYADAALKGGYQLLDLVNQVLDMAGIEAGRLKVDLESVGIAEKIENVTKMLQPSAAKRGITIETEVAPGLAVVRADVMRLRQVLLNLGSNAVKYNRAGGKVRIAATPAPNGRVRFTVEDSGPGIPVERQNAVFQPFARLGAEFTAVEGTGLGLAISKQLVEAMDGSIGFDSTPGSGSRFWIEMPVAAATRPEAAPAKQTGEIAAAKPVQHAVLYIEDDPASLQLVTLLLSSRPGFLPLSAATGGGGLDIAVRQRPAAIVVDINLPDMHGLDLLRRLKSAPETRGIPVMALSASAMPADVRRGLDAGFFRYLTKPLDVKAFMQALDDAIAVRQAVA